MVNRRTGKAEVFRMRGSFPKIASACIFSSFVLTQLSQKWIYYSAAESQVFSYSSLGHLFVGVVCFSVTSAACWSYHRMEIIDAIGGNKRMADLKRNIDIYSSLKVRPRKLDMSEGIINIFLMGW